MAACSPGMVDVSSSLTCVDHELAHRIVQHHHKPFRYASFDRLHLNGRAQFNFVCV